MCVLFIACGSQKQAIVGNDDYQILEEILKEEKAKMLSIKVFNNYKPIVYLNRYKVFNNESDAKTDSLLTILNGEVEWILSDSDIEYLQNKYTDWDNKNWDKSLLHTDVKIYEGEKLPVRSEETIYIISHPLYDETHSKAMVIESRYKDISNTLIRIKLFKKSNNKWLKVGSLFSGHY